MRMDVTGPVLDGDDLEGLNDAVKKSAAEGASVVVILKPDLTQFYELYPGDRMYIRLPEGAGANIFAAGKGKSLEGLLDLL